MELHFLVVAFRFSIWQLLLFAALVSGFSQRKPANKTEWKEYAYPEDRFAITLPHEPRSHAEAGIPNMWVYSVDLEASSVLSIHVSRTKRDCNAALAQLKDGALKGKSGIDSTSVKEPKIDGHAGLQYLYTYDPESDRQYFSRYYCVDGILYAFAAGWDKQKPRPASLEKILDSFRILKR